MAPPTNLERAEAERDAVSVILAAIEPNVTNHAVVPLAAPLVDCYIEQCSAQLTILFELNTRILTLRPADPDAHKVEFTRMFNLVNLLHSTLHGIKATFPAASTANPGGSAPPQPRQDVRLPRLDIPPFTGNLMDWVSFRDMFTTVIHSSTTYSGTQKLAHLKSLVQGEPFRLISSLILSDANYDIAWALLNDRYQNDREFLFAILRRLSSLPSLHTASAADVRNLVDTTRECIRSLGVLGIGRDKGMDAVILFQIFNKMDNTSRELWEQTLKDTSIPKLDDLFEFLEKRARSLSASGPTKQSSQPRLQHERQDAKRKTLVNHSSEFNSSCRVCQGNHPIYKCHSFNSKDEAGKSETVKKLNLCFNCLQSGHSINKCPSNSRCRTCNGKHHTLIHRESNSNPRSEGNSEPVVYQPKSSGPSSQASNPSTQGPSRRQEHGNHANEGVVCSSLLATALVRIIDGHGQQQICRAFLDSGATSSFITTSCQQRLNLKTTKSTTEVLGLSSTSVGSARGSATLYLSSHIAPSFKFTVNALILPKLTGNLPVSQVDPSHWSHLKGLKLADPQFHAPKPIDILLGSDVFWNLLSDGKHSGPADAPVAFNSKLGWLVAGPTASSSKNVRANFSNIKSHMKNEDDATAPLSQTLASLDSTLRSFWEIESIPPMKTLSSEEIACERHFKDHVCRLEDGRYQVRLPLKRPATDLGDSKQIAIRRLKSIERRLENNPRYKQDYDDFMKEYLNLKHMSLVTKEDPGIPVSYIPHHYVLKEDSTTTKFRVVFDASAKTSSGVSLNDIMMVGPVIQDTLVDIIMRFRCHPIAYTADIAKMYRQIRVPPEDAELQRILWRFSPNEPINIYRLDTVSYGTASAPFLATKILQQLVRDEPDFPIAAPIILNDFYVDDLMSGSTDVNTAKQEVEQILQLTSKAGLSLRKWSSNSKDLLAAIPEELLNSKTKEPSKDAIQDLTNCFVSTDRSVKCLGILWDTDKDCFRFRVNLPHSEQVVYTKRTILSEIARLFDPLGWLAPVIISAKIFMQSLWKLEVSWDQPLTEDIQEYWINFKRTLEHLAELRIPRCVVQNTFSSLSLIGYSDASEKAYSAVVYLCANQESTNPSMTMIASKTRVAPAKTISLPRLELCGAHLLSQLLSDVRKGLKRPIASTMAFSDSTVTLAWIKMCPSKMKTYVANRVTDITSVIPSESWYHIAGSNNPADCASRGISPRELIQHSLWWNGPSTILSQAEPSYTEEEYAEIAKEQRPTTLVMTTTIDNSLIAQLIKDKSSFSSLLHVVGWLRRFISVCRKTTPRSHGHLRVSELKEAEALIIQKVQESEFMPEIIALRNNRQVDFKSKIASLSPILDERGLLRVGGRLRHAPISYDKKHPILLPRHSRLTEMVIINKHHELQHAGPQLLLAVLQRQYWIVRGRDAIRFLLRKCISCHRQRATNMSQIMGDLPSFRVTANLPFYCTGVDYAGPFNLKTEAVRSKITFKAYLCIFVCFATRAIHIEIASSLSTSAFIAALKRFVSRRSCPAEIFSDCGTNFVGAAKELKEFQTFISSKTFNNKVTNVMSTKGIQWHFNPPSAPHFGGLWEAGVKSVKFHLHRVLGAARLTYEELSTLMCQIEASLNSRPLTPVSSNPDDLAALTPGHFLVGTSLTSVPETDLLDLKTGRLDRWQLVQQMRQQFWKRWSNEYMSRLQQRPKWLKQRSIPSVGDLTIIKDDRLPPQQWKLGRIIKLYPGADGFPRVADLKTNDGEIKRPIVKLSLLPIQNDTSSDSF